MTKACLKMIIASSLLVSFGCHAGISDASGRIWTPDGGYYNHGIGAEAKFDSHRKYGELSMGNACVLAGRLTHPNKQKPIFILTVKESDGIECPSVNKITIQVVDGYGTRALGNASVLKISHTKQSRRISFAGTYRYDSSL